MQQNNTPKMFVIQPARQTFVKLMFFYINMTTSKHLCESVYVWVQSIFLLNEFFVSQTGKLNYSKWKGDSLMQFQDKTVKSSF